MNHLIPIVIGITGHRDLAPQMEGPLLEQVRALLCEVRARYPHSPVTVLSPIAAGADALCARAALETGCTLAAPLPMDAADYREDFTPEEARIFDGLREQAADCFVVPGIEPCPAQPGRGWHYRQAGLYVAAHSHLLLALWDGEETLTCDGCGTYETVRQMLGGPLDGPAASAAPAKSGPVLQIVTPRGGAAESGDALPMKLHLPGGAVEAADGLPRLEEFEDIEAFNREVADNLSRIEESRAGCIEGCVDTAVLPGLDSSQTALLGAFAAADALAIHHQKRRVRVLQALSFVALAMVLSFLLYDEAASFVFLVVYGVLLIPAAAVYLLSTRRRYHDKYLLFRTLAETLRVQFYLRLAGLSVPWFSIPAWRRERPLTFVENAAAGFYPLPTKSTEGLDAAQRCWVDGQLAYHRRSLQKKGRKNRFNDSAGRAILLAAVLFYCVVLLLEIFAPALMGQPLLSLPGFAFELSGLTKIILGALFAAAAFLSNYYGKMDLPRQMGSDEQMAALFSLAAKSLARHENDPAARRGILMELARAHSEENISWFVYQSGNAPEFIID